MIGRILLGDINFKLCSIKKSQSVVLYIQNKKVMHNMHLYIMKLCGSYLYVVGYFSLSCPIKLTTSGSLYETQPICKCTAH